MPVDPARGPLPGVNVLVTRPRHQARHLCALVEAAGGSALHVPVIEIVPPENMRTARAVAQELADFYMAVFVSANAVRGAQSLITSLPETLQTAAIGRRTAAEMRRCGWRVDVLPLGTENTEGLLNTDELRDVRGRRLVIFRGEGGREELAAVLRARGASVTYAEVYRRALPPECTPALARIADTVPVDIIVVTSGAGLANLYKAAGEVRRGWLLQTPLAVISERTARAARKLGFRRDVYVARESSDAGLVAAIKEWYAAGGRGDSA